MVILGWEGAFSISLKSPRTNGWKDIEALLKDDLDELGFRMRVSTDVFEMRRY
jgi:hypothetical protein